MNIAFHNGVSGLIGYQQDLDVLAHNMANVNTNGFKESSSVFEDLLYTEMDTNAEDKHPTGHGMRIRNLNLSMEQGSPRQTNSPLDFAIMGEGFFAVERNGRVEYTRNGSLRIGMEGNDGYLVASDGGYMLDSKGQRIKLDRDKETNLFATDNIVDKLEFIFFPIHMDWSRPPRAALCRQRFPASPISMRATLTSAARMGRIKVPTRCCRWR